MLGRTQPTRGSGTKRFPRTHSDSRCFQLLRPEEMGVTSDPTDEPWDDEVKVFMSVDAPRPIRRR